MKITSVGAPTTYIQEPRSVEGVGRLGQSAGTGPQGAFGDKLAEAVDRVSDQQLQADDKLAKLASGEDTDIHGTMIALEEANITLRTMTTVRDKVVAAYQEIMNMSI